MTDPDLSLYIDNCRHFEGVVPWLYLDTKGNVTIAVGKLVPTLGVADSLPLKIFSDSTIASSDQIASDWSRIKSMPFGPKYGNRYFHAKTSVYMIDSDINALLSFTIQPILTELKAVFIAWSSYVSGVKQVVVDMAYQLGVTGLQDDFPQFCLDIKAEKWADAAAESHRRDANADRNLWASRLLTAAA